MSASGINLQNSFINLNVEIGLNGASVKKINDPTKKVEEKQNKNPDLEFEKHHEMPTKDGSDEDKKIEELKKRDQKVKKHERDHLIAAGNLATGSPRYDYTVGPDGKRYATGGEVQIDISPVPDDPEATIEKAKKIIKAALAPEEPSVKDRQIAAKAKR